FFARIVSLAKFSSIIAFVLVNHSAWSINVLSGVLVSCLQILILVVLLAFAKTHKPNNFVKREAEFAVFYISMGVIQSILWTLNPENPIHEPRSVLILAVGSFWLFMESSARE